MKTISPFINAAALVAAVVALQTIPLAQAQPNSDNPGRQRPQAGQNQMDDRRPQGERFGGPQGGQQGFQPGGQGGPGMNLMERVLTDDQRDSMRQSLEANREKSREAMEKIREARKALNQAALADEFKENVVRAKALDVAKLEAELTVTRLKALSEVQPALSKEQLEQIMNPPQFRPQAGAPDGEGQRPNNRRMNRQRPGPDGGDDMPQPPKRDPQ